MKKLTYYFICFFFISSSVISQSGWVWQNPLPQGNWLSGICVLPANGIITVGDGGTILKSTDNGVNWTIKNNNFGLNARHFYSVRFYNNNTGWICGDSGSILISTDAGNNWNFQNVNLSKPLYKIYIADANNIFVCGAKGQVLKSSNSGSIWNNINIPDTTVNLYDIYFTNVLTGFVCGVWPPNGPPFHPHGVVYKTTNGGMNWNINQTNIMASGYNSVSFLNAQTGYLGGYFSDTVNGNILAKTTDAGNNWVRLNTNYSTIANLYTVKFLNEQTGWINSGIGMYKTTDGSLTWTLKYSTTGSTCDEGFVDMSILGNQIYGVDCKNIIRTTNSGDNWQNLTSGSRSGCYSIQFVNSNYGWSNNYNGLYKTTDGGSNWLTIPVPGSTGDPNFRFINQNTGWVLGGNINGNYMLKTTNGGYNWNPDQTTNYASNLFFINSTTGYIQADTFPANVSRIFRTTNAGATWQIIFSQENTVLDNLQFVNINIGYALNGNNSSGERQLIKSTNGGLNWFSVDTISTGSYGVELTFYDENTGWIAINQPPNYSFFELYKTTNGGRNWVSQNLGHYTFTYIRNIKFLNSLTGFASSEKASYLNSYGYLLKTTDGGNNWYVSDPGIANGIWDISFINENTGWICGGEGSILKTTNGGGIIGITEISSNIPKTFSLLQNYPNPFNPTTNIKFNVPLSSKNELVQLKIYDILGREVNILVNESLKPGSYQVEWDGSQFASGVYFYKLVVGDNTNNGEFTDTKKMVLIK